MTTVMPAHPPKKPRCPAWLYFCVCLNYRDGEELLFARGIIVTYESIRQWGQKFGQQYANH
jgi:putative transposase